jgi:hypothetical protein
VLFQRVKQNGSKAEIALHKFFGILRTVYAREVEDEIRFRAIFVQKLVSSIYIIFKNLINDDRRTGSVLAVTDIFQVGAQVFSNEALCAGYKYIHRLKRPLQSLFAPIHVSFNHFRRNTCNNRIFFGERFCYDSARSDNRIFRNHDAFIDQNTVSYPNMVSDLNVCRLVDSVTRHIKNGMRISSSQNNFRGTQAIISDFDFSSLCTRQMNFTAQIRLITNDNAVIIILYVYIALIDGSILTDLYHVVVSANTYGGIAKDSAFMKNNRIFSI